MFETTVQAARSEALSGKETPCFHCGDACGSGSIVLGEKSFCCSGCRTVYELLEEKNLCAYYALDRAPGHAPKDCNHARRFEFLDDESVARPLIDYRDDAISTVTFTIPVMHCSSCIWLLENLGRLHAGVVRSRVDFPRKEATIAFRHGSLPLRGLVELLASIGYEPVINLQSVSEKRRARTDRSLYYRIGVAGFAFGNVMLLSLPEYLAADGTLDPEFSAFFSAVNLLLSIPVLLYSAGEYYRSAWTGLRERRLTIDVPITLGILMLFGRSVFDIVSGTGPGYLDSFTGLVFLLLIGKLFQKKTYDALSFERDFRSYFPLSITVRDGGAESVIPLTKLKVGDRVLVRNQELIPADAVLLNGDARIDYSFVTGESELLEKKSGDVLYAGGRQSGRLIELEVIREISQSYLTRLWNNDAFAKPGGTRFIRMVDRISGMFTAAVLTIAFGAALYWSVADSSLVPTVFTAVLIVACPCALAMATPFALGSAQRVLGNNGFYVKNTETVESLARVDTIVFDKTGTLTRAGTAGLDFHGRDLSPDERRRIVSLARHSTHALSRLLVSRIDARPDLPVHGYEEVPGMGIAGVVDGVPVRIGSAAWTGAPAVREGDPRRGSVHIAVDGSYSGCYFIGHSFRKGLREVLKGLRKRCSFMVLSGDTGLERGALREAFGTDVPMLFEQSPDDKLRVIESLRAGGRRVLMIGDGLNDAGALRAADVGISITEDINAFSPAGDAILSAGEFHRLDRMLGFTRAAAGFVKASFALSFLYNVAGLGFAVAGLLSPLVCAILMPVSSVSVIAFTTLATRLAARRAGFR